MKIGRETLVLVAAPIGMLGAAALLLFGGERPISSSTSFFDQRGAERLLAEDRGQDALPSATDLGPGATRARPAAASSGDQQAGPVHTTPFQPRSPVVEASADDHPDALQQGPEGATAGRRPLEGRITGPHGQPLRNARVRVVEHPNLMTGGDDQPVAGEPDEYEVILDEAARFSLKREPGVLYEIVIEARDLGVHSVQSFGASRPLEIQLPLPGTISGRVLRVKDNKPESGVLVSLRSGHGPERHTTTNASGNYQFVAVPPGLVLLSAVQPGFLLQRRFVHVNSGSQTRADMLLERGSRLHGLVLVEGLALAAPGIDVAVEDPSRREIIFTGRTDAEGRFEVPSLEPGRIYAVRLKDPASVYGAMVNLFQTGPTPPFDEVVLTVLPAVSATVHVKDMTGASLAGAQVRISATMYAMEVMRETVTAGPDGVAVFDGLDPRSRVSFQAWKEGYALGVQPPTLLQQFLPEASWTLTLSGALALHGNVEDPDGEPVRGALVRVVPVGLERVPLARLSTITDEHGNFAFRGLAPGDLRITVVAPGHSPWTSTLTLGPAAAAAPARVILQPLK